jgi:hypothetical protein
LFINGTLVERSETHRPQPVLNANLVLIVGVYTTMHRWILFFLALSLLPVQISHAAPLVSSSTETPAPGEKVPPAAVVQAIVGSVDKDDLDRLKACMADLKIRKGAFRRLFRSVALPVMKNGEELYFVRPALKPYCNAFYGAHVFRFWLIAGDKGATPKTYKVRYAGAADDFQVLPSTGNGSCDIAETNCTAWRCLTVFMKFDGEKYAPFRCIEKTDQENGGEIEREVPCSR